MSAARRAREETFGAIQLPIITPGTEPMSSDAASPQSTVLPLTCPAAVAVTSSAARKTSVPTMRDVAIG